MEVIKIEVPKYNPEKGIEYNWETGFVIETKIDDGVIKISANKEGLISLANHLLNLSQDEIPLAYHVHFDEYNAFEESSVALIIEKK